MALPDRLRRVLTPGRLRRANPDAAREALREEIAQHRGAGVEKEDRDRLLGALDLADRTVDEIMRHRRVIEMIDLTDPPEAVVRQVLASAHSRLPVHDGEPENVIGVLHAKDLWRETERLAREGEGLAGLDLRRVAMKPYFIPETTSLADQMRAFLKRRTPFALVVDEYGALKGLITLEDILEEIVGEITDEFDASPAAGLKRNDQGDWLVDGAMTIRDLNRALDWHLPDSDANTIAGLVIHEAQCIPEAGQIFRFHGCRFEVAERRENRITRLAIRPDPRAGQ